MARVVLVIDVHGADPTLIDPHEVAEDLTGENVGDLFTLWGKRDAHVESAEWAD